MVTNKMMGSGYKKEEDENNLKKKKKGRWLIEHHPSHAWPPRLGLSLMGSRVGVLSACSGEMSF